MEHSNLTAPQYDLNQASSSNQPPVPTTFLPSAGTLAQVQPSPATPSSIRVTEQLMYKNRLQEYAQRSSIPLPVYQTINEGSQHAPRFRSTVVVDGISITTENTFSQRKAAEQDAARLAMESITNKIRNEGCPLIYQDTMLCKSILNEYAVKLSLERPQYKTVQRDGLIPVFVSSLAFNGINYTGDAARSKKEAEQLAARAVILSILGDPGSGTALTEIIRSKSKLYASINKLRDSQNAQTSLVPNVTNTLTSNTLDCIKKEVAAPVAASYNQTLAAVSESSSGILPPGQEIQMSKQESTSINTQFPNASVETVLRQPSDEGSSSKKRRKNKKKANKKPRFDEPLPIPALPLNQLPPCSVGQ
ncbi:hypothetical protein L6164_030802 [Bauhinia variegata]|uniref:Uncharacterized protein n=1 Tax=Bauhinia variegata TaxID=167791 RepID=A0ACB9LER5_BAUVA|nr:hypothetical protein L6164_030802 [Bauhinia variegata]